MSGKYYWFAYPTKGKEFRERNYASHLDIHRLRDPVMMLTLAGVVQGCGLVFGGVITNIRSVDLNREKETIAPKSPVLTAADVVILPTRPPLTYKASDRIPSVAPSGTDIERRVLAAASKFFRQLSRREAELSPDISAHFSAAAARYQNLQFSLYGGAEIDAKGLKSHSIAYLFTVPSAFKEGTTAAQISRALCRDPGSVP